MRLLHAKKGNVQLLDENEGCLKIVAHRGFDKPFLEFLVQLLPAALHHAQQRKRARNGWLLLMM